MHLPTHTPIWKLSIILMLGALVYLPGVSGPYVFDDYSNLVENIYVKVNSLTFSSLYQAAYSLSAGPLQRPVAMLSFAVNYYFAGGFGSTAPYKIVNVVLHGTNGLLIFWLARLIFVRLAHIQNLTGGRITEAPRTLVAGAIALLWIIHPIQLTSVLYIAQRMTELSALFTLLGLICYIKARVRFTSGQGKSGIWLLLLGLGVCWPLGLLSKETALLLPVFILAIEAVLFSDEPPWQRLRTLPTTAKRVVFSAVAIATMLLLVAAVNYALPGYELRQFTLTERLLTEARVLFFYLSLILVPRLDQFGLLHDDIPLSTGLLTPWTTLPAMIGIIGLLMTALLIRTRRPLLSLGILWFFAAHLLESSFFALEIAHEHRNYLALFGVLLAIIDIIDGIRTRSGHILRPWHLLPLFATLLAGTTIVRAFQWSDASNLFLYEALHHPDSAGAQSGLANLLLAQGQYDQSKQAMRRASDLSPREAGYLISLLMVSAQHDDAIRAEDLREIIRRLSSNPPSPLTNWAVSNASECLTEKCKSLQVPMEAWMHTLLAKSSDKPTSSYYYYFLGRALFGQGRINEAIVAYRRSYELDPYYFHPVFELANIYILLGRKKYAEAILAELHRMNSKNPHKRGSEIQKLEAAIDAMPNSGKSNTVGPHGD